MEDTPECFTYSVAAWFAVIVHPKARNDRRKALFLRCLKMPRDITLAWLLSPPEGEGRSRCCPARYPAGGGPTRLRPLAGGSARPTPTYADGRLNAGKMKRLGSKHVLSSRRSEFLPIPTFPNSARARAKHRCTPSSVDAPRLIANM